MPTEEKIVGVFDGNDRRAEEKKNGILIEQADGKGGTAKGDAHRGHRLRVDLFQCGVALVRRDRRQKTRHDELVEVNFVRVEIGAEVSWMDVRIGEEEKTHQNPADRQEIVVLVQQVLPQVSQRRRRENAVAFARRRRTEDRREQISQPQWTEEDDFLLRSQFVQEENFSFVFQRQGDLIDQIRETIFLD